MRKSEYEAARHKVWAYRADARSWSACVADDVAAAEAAGVVWDPEEEPMAGRLAAADLYGVPCFADPQWSLALVLRGGFRSRLMTKREAEVAADLYNRRKNIATVAGELRLLAQASGCDHGTLFASEVRRWADLLEGKEKS